MNDEQLKRIADAMEEILRLVKKDQEDSAARQRQRDSEWKELNIEILHTIFYKIIGASRAPMLPAASAFLKASSSTGQEPGPKLQASSVKPQASSLNLNTIK